MPVPTFVDLQGFIVSNKFIVKEVAVLRGNVLAHYIFQNPMPWHLLTRFEQRQALWLMTNHHELEWKDGTVVYNMAKHLITTAVVGGLHEEPAGPRLALVLFVVSASGGCHSATAFSREKYSRLTMNSDTSSGEFGRLNGLPEMSTSTKGFASFATRQLSSQVRKCILSWKLVTVE